MNARIADFPKPVVALMQGFVMGGGVGIGGHASQRIVGDSTQIAMPEAGIGLIPDVGGSWLLGHAPGRCGEYLGLTAARMGAGDAIYTGFADHYLPEAEWPQLIERLAETGDPSVIRPQPAPPASLEGKDLSAFGGDSPAAIIAALEAAGAEDMLKPLRRNSPLSMAATLALVRAARGCLGPRQPGAGVPLYRARLDRKRFRRRRAGTDHRQGSQPALVGGRQPRACARPAVAAWCG